MRKLVSIPSQFDHRLIQEVVRIGFGYLQDAQAQAPNPVDLTQVDLHFIQSVRRVELPRAIVSYPVGRAAPLTPDADLPLRFNTVAYQSFVRKNADPAQLGFTMIEKGSMLFDGDDRRSCQAEIHFRAIPIENFNRFLNTVIDSPHREFIGEKLAEVRAEVGEPTWCHCRIDFSSLTRQSMPVSPLFHVDHIRTTAFNDYLDPFRRTTLILGSSSKGQTESARFLGDTVPVLLNQAYNPDHPTDIDEMFHRASIAWSADRYKIEIVETCPMMWNVLGPNTIHRSNAHIPLNGRFWIAIDL